MYQNQLYQNQAYQPQPVKKGMSTGKVILIGIGTFAICAGLVFGGVFAFLKSGAITVNSSSGEVAKSVTEKETETEETETETATEQETIAETETETTQEDSLISKFQEEAQSKGNSSYNKDYVYNIIRESEKEASYDDEDALYNYYEEMFGLPLTKRVGSSSYGYARLSGNWETAGQNKEMYKIMNEDGNLIVALYKTDATEYAAEENMKYADKSDLPVQLHDSIVETILISLDTDLSEMVSYYVDDEELDNGDVGCYSLVGVPYDDGYVYIFTVSAYSADTDEVYMYFVLGYDCDEDEFDQACNELYTSYTLE
jgi:cell division protein FtsB